MRRAGSLWHKNAGGATPRNRPRHIDGPHYYILGVCGLIMRDSKSRSSCSIYQGTPVISVVSQQQTGVSVTIHLSTRQSLQSKVVSLYIFLSSHL